MKKALTFAARFDDTARDWKSESSLEVARDKGKQLLRRGKRVCLGVEDSEKEK